MSHNPFYRKRRRIVYENSRYLLRDEESGLVIPLDGLWEVASLNQDASELQFAALAVKGVIPATQG